ncbi:MAG: FG-GAP repeat protein [Planctomycetota bacterium]
MRWRSFRSKVSLVAMMVTLSLPCLAGHVGQRQKLVPSDGASGDRYGSALAKDGEWVIVGATKHTGTQTEQGAAYVYRRTKIGTWDQGGTWAETQRLVLPTAAVKDWFGWAADMDGASAVVSAYRRDVGAVADAGAVYLYGLSGSVWMEDQAIENPEAESADAFGYSVSLDGGVLVVGNPYDDDASPGDMVCNSGSVYVFRKNGAAYLLEQKLIASDPTCGAWFGFSCDLDGSVLAVGAPHAPGIVADAGAVYVFRFNGSSWVEEQKIAATDGAAAEGFAHTVELDGNRLFAGDQLDDTDTGADAGSVYAFAFNGTAWDLTQKITPAAPSAGENFGFSLAVEQNDLVIGAIRTDLAGTNTGSLYHFTWNGAQWVELAQFTAADAEPEAALGYRALMQDGVAFMTSTQQSEGGVKMGAAYEFLINTRAAYDYYGRQTRFRSGYAYLRTGTHARRQRRRGNRALPAARALRHGSALRRHREPQRGYSPGQRQRDHDPVRDLENRNEPHQPHHSRRSGTVRRRRLPPGLRLHGGR